MLYALLLLQTWRIERLAMLSGRFGAASRNSRAGHAATEQLQRRGLRSIRRNIYRRKRVAEFPRNDVVIASGGAGARRETDKRIGVRRTLTRSTAYDT
jgi:hypothetical protein